MIDIKETKISSQRVVAFKNIFASKPNFEVKEISQFFEYYLLCEVLANKLLEYFNEDRPSKVNHRKCQNCGIEIKIKRQKFKSLNVEEIKKSLTYFSINFDSHDTDAIFRSVVKGSSEPSARGLRNKYLHSLSPSAYKQIVELAPDFLSLMDRFCKAVSEKIEN